MGNAWFIFTNIKEIDLPKDIRFFHVLHNYRRLLQIIESNSKNDLEMFMSKANSEYTSELCLRVNPNDCLKRTILNYIASNSDFNDLLEIMLKYCVKKELLADALVWAITSANVRGVKLLVDYGVNINQKSSTGSSALHVAIRVGNTEIVQYLLEHNANVNIQDKENKTSLHIACDLCNLDLVKCLVQYGCSTELRDCNGWTAMHIATGHNDIDIVKHLVVHGASIHIPDLNGQRPITWARFFNSAEVHKYLTHLIRLQLKSHHHQQQQQQLAAAQQMFKNNNKEDAE